MHAVKVILLQSDLIKRRFSVNQGGIDIKECKKKRGFQSFHGWLSARAKPRQRVVVRDGRTGRQEKKNRKPLLFVVAGVLRHSNSVSQVGRIDSSYFATNNVSCVYILSFYVYIPVNLVSLNLVSAMFIFSLKHNILYLHQHY